jgi:hypothetical protein
MCPHQNIVHCPLYVAAHSGYIATAERGCISGDWHEGCEVDRGETVYVEAVSRLAKVCPRLVQNCVDRESAELARLQRQRNLRAAGLH